VISVSLDLTTTLDTTASGSLGFTIPIIGPTGTVGPSGSASHEVSNTQELSFPLFPVADSSFRMDTSTAAPAPIADAIFALREALIRSSALEAVCFYDFNYHDPKSDKGGTFKLGLTITDDGKGGVDVKLAVVDVGANYERKSVTGNTITIAFQQAKVPPKAPPLDKFGRPTGLGGFGEAAPEPGPAPK
jgi:hypothetical protein